ncbi:MAG: AraC family transcriptional regulator [Bacteroidetes bacterium]|nr:MAG: AraC family transcriptional regulator [Bacteroidota bacterium]
MFLRMEESAQREWVGMKIRMSFATNQTRELWQRFMPKKGELQPKNDLLFSIERYPDDFFQSFDPTREFEKWAAVEVVEPTSIPNGMAKLTSPAGIYAVFLHKGTPEEGPKTYGYIFETWLPASGYQLDHRPHFAVMGERYSNHDPNSEEEIWIPVKNRATPL